MLTLRFGSAAGQRRPPPNYGGLDRPRRAHWLDHAGPWRADAREVSYLNQAPNTPTNSLP
jgi:hypothetical protein